MVVIFVTRRHLWTNYNNSRTQLPAGKLYLTHLSEIWGNREDREGPLMGSSLLLTDELHVYQKKIEKRVRSLFLH